MIGYGRTSETFREKFPTPSKALCLSLARGSSRALPLTRSGTFREKLPDTPKSFMPVPRLEDVPITRRTWRQPCVARFTFARRREYRHPTPAEGLAFGKEAHKNIATASRVNSRFGRDVSMLIRSADPPPAHRSGLSVGYHLRLNTSNIA